MATSNGGATVGRLESGDWIRLTWNEAIAPASVLAGWNGSSTAVRVRVANNASSDEHGFLQLGRNTGSTLCSDRPI